MSQVYKAKKKLLAFIFVLVFTAACLVPTMNVQAAVTSVYSYGTSVKVPTNGTSITVDKIKFNNVTVESVYKKYGTYSSSDKTYCCAAFVSKFYKKTLNITVSNLNSISSTPKASIGSFKTTTSPQVGDIVRWNKSVHWSIVKAVNGDKITLIQQNYWNSAHTAALKNVVINKNSSNFTFFHWDGFITDSKITLSSTNYTYNGSVQTPSVTVSLNNKTLKNGTDYYLTYSNSSSKTPGSYNVTITGKGNYIGKVTKTYKINQAKISSAALTVNKLYVYTGSAIKPSVKLTYKGMTLKSGTDYTVAYSNNKNTGKATITITGKGNYTGTKSDYFVIKPVKMATPTASSTASAQRTTINVSWKAVGGNVAGYEIAYKKNSSSSWTTVNVASSKTSYAITSGLSRLTKYNVKIRAYTTIDGKKVYGEYSATKTLTTPVLK